MLKHAESRRFELNTLGKLACNFSTLLKFLAGKFFRKSVTESERSD